MLRNLELQILELHNSLTFTPTVEKLAKLGDLLIEAKGHLNHGEFIPWVKRIGLNPRSANLYMQVARNPPADPNISLRRFLDLIRTGTRAARTEERKRAVQETILNSTSADLRYVVHCADCRRHPWPDVVDCIATDPPWASMSAYKWLAQFAADRLREGGIALVQCGTPDIPEVADLFVSAGLKFCWCLAIVYDQSFPMRAYPLAQTWRPVLVLSKGRWKYGGLKRVSDVYTVRWWGPKVKSHHDWEQPLAPWKHWLEALTRPGEVVADAYAGTGTVGVACKLAGGRSYIGTEIETKTALIARGRIAGVVEGG